MLFFILEKSNTYTPKIWENDYKDAQVLKKSNTSFWP